jgi:uncharacterized coiled-coil DUF342 family protein
VCLNYLSSVFLCYLKKTAALSNEVTELKFQLAKSELEFKEVSEALSKTREKESELQACLLEAQEESSAARLEAKQADGALKVSFFNDVFW